MNDALVLVDFINRARRDRVPMLEAVEQAGAQRLRPVILTTMTTVVALLPMAFGLVGSSRATGPSRRPSPSACSSQWSARSS